MVQNLYEHTETLDIVGQEPVEFKRTNAMLVRRIANEFNLGHATVESILRRERQIYLEELEQLNSVNIIGITTVDANLRNGQVVVRSRTSATLAERIQEGINKRNGGTSV